MLAQKPGELERTKATEILLLFSPFVCHFYEKKYNKYTSSEQSVPERKYDRCLNMKVFNKINCIHKCTIIWSKLFVKTNTIYSELDPENNMKKRAGKS